MPTTDSHTATCVSHGIGYLDATRSGWRSQIDTDTLDMNYLHSCVLGQLNLTDRVFPTETLSWQSEHGFWVLGGAPADYDELTAEWVRQINEQRGASIE